MNRTNTAFAAAVFSIMLAGLFVTRAGATVPVQPLMHTAPALTKPMTVFNARKITVNSTSAKSVNDWLGTAAPGNSCAVALFMLAAETTQVNVGGSDVDNTSKFIPICGGGGAGCMQSSLSVDANPSQVFLRLASAGSATVYVLLGGGC